MNYIYYRNVWSSLKTIYTEEGVEGLFSGLVPRIIRDLSYIIILTSLSFAIKAYLTNNKNYQRFLHCLSSVSYNYYILFQLSFRNNNYYYL